jgi:hypothetical protein
MSVNMLAGVKIKHGADSAEYEMAGGTRASDRKRPVRKPKNRSRKFACRFLNLRLPQRSVLTRLDIGSVPGSAAQKVEGLSSAKADDVQIAQRFSAGIRNVTRAASP